MRHHATSFIITAHAAQRIQQRGLRREAVELVLRTRDRRVSVGGGCEAWSVSRERSRALRAAGLPSSLIDRVARTILVVEPLTGAVVTAINGHTKTPKRLRRHSPGRRRRAAARP